jgi:hypothetical protein
MTRHSSPAPSIVAVAMTQLALSALSLAWLAAKVPDYFFGGMPTDDFLVLLVILLGSALLGVITATGLLRLQNWARLVSLCLVTAALFADATALKLHRRQIGFDFTPMILAFLLWVLIPVAVWWWIVLARPLDRAASSQNPMNLVPGKLPKWRIAVVSLALLGWLGVGLFAVYRFLNPAPKHFSF